MHIKKEDIPVREGHELFKGDPAYAFHSMPAGNMEVGWYTVPPADCTSVYEGLPDGMCVCPHWGYLFKGRLRVKYGDGTEEVIGPGEVYYIPARHVLIYEEETECIEFNPAAELSRLMKAVDANHKKSQSK